MAFTYLPVRVANQIFALQVLTVVFIENSYHEMRHHALWALSVEARVASCVIFYVSRPRFLSSTEARGVGCVF